MRAVPTAAACRGAIHALLAVHLAVSLPASARIQRDTVVRVLEPNVVKLEGAGTVTLAGAYVPKRLPSCFAYDPAAALRRTLPKSTAVDVDTFPGKGSQKLAWIYRTRDGVLVQSLLVEGGWAQAGRLGDTSDASDARASDLRDKQASAKAKGVGLWQDCDAAAAATAANPNRVDLDMQFEPLPGSEFEFGRAAPAAVGAVAAATRETLPNPGDTKNCVDFEFFEDAKQFYDRYFPLYGDVAKLDRDEDGVPCPGLPHTPRRELYQPKKPRPEFRLPVADSQGATSPN